MAGMDLAGATDLLRARVPGLRVVWLHGSHARGDAREASDVDLALVADAPLELSELLALESDLAVVLGDEVDLVDLFGSDDVLRLQVIEHGRVLFARTPADLARFEMHALSRYARLQEERRAILQDIVRRGSVHG